MLKNKGLRQTFRYIELLGVILTISLLPIDRFPYLHSTPLKLGAISFILLLVAAAGRFLRIIYDKRWTDLKRILLVSSVILLPVLGYTQSIHYAIDRVLAVGATQLLLIAALKGVCIFILLYENRALWQVVKKTIYAVTVAIVAFGFFQFLFDVFGASPKITDLLSCCTSNSTYIFPRVHSASLEPLYFANFLLLPIWLMLYDFISNKTARRNKLLISLFIATSSLFVLTLARSAILALILSGVVFILGLGQKDGLKKLVPRMSKAVVLILVITIAFVMLSGLASKFIPKSPIHGADSGVTGSVSLFSSHALNVADESAQTRYSLWPKAITYIKEEPLQGVGAYNSRVRLNLEKYQAGTPDLHLQPFNNDLIGLLVDLGLIGLIVFAPLAVAYLISLIKLMKLHWNSKITPYALAALAMLIQSNFFHSILLARVWVVLGVALAGLYVLQGGTKRV